MVTPSFTPSDGVFITSNGAGGGTLLVSVRLFPAVDGGVALVTSLTVSAVEQVCSADYNPPVPLPPVGVCFGKCHPWRVDTDGRNDNA